MAPLWVNLLKVAFVAALYLFLWTVVRAVRTHLAGPVTVERSAAHVLFVTAPPEVHGRVIPVETPTLVGRGREADITLDDPFISDRHVRFDRVENRLVVEDLGSTNGTQVNGLPVTGRRVLDRGDVVRVGQTMMEVR
jgi:pSer/pThr/pTyr-binding forkhead associated (FHA) protein